MKIKSKFKDYYDFVAHAYGGGDPKFVYVRAPLDDAQLVVDVCSTSPFESYSVRSLDTYDVHYKYLCIAGKSYLLLAKRPDANSPMSEYRLFTEQDFPEEYKKLVKRSRWHGDTRYEDFVGIELPVLTEISKQIEEPVFMINRIERFVGNRYRVTLDKQIPILNEYGIASLIPPEQLYQTISYYFSNQMRVSPDLAIIDTMSNKEKISQHGFDLKQSFRHRK